MSKILKSIGAEWQHLLHDKILLISFIVMFIIPILYGGFFLGSIWDPYGKTSQLPVAVVNNDEAQTVDGKSVHIGQDVVDNLKQNHDVKWDFVSEDKAKEGINNGHYYMMIELPKDFSKNSTTITSDNPVKSKLVYTVTPSKNFVGSLISQQVADKVVGNVSRSISNNYAKAVLANIDKIGKGMKTAADGSGKITDGSRTLTGGINKYTSGVSQMANGQVALASGTQQLQQGANQLAGGLNALNSQLPSAEQIAQLNNGALQIKNGLGALQAAVNAPNPQLDELKNKVNQQANALGAAALSYQQLAGQNQASLFNLGKEAKIAQMTGQTAVTVEVSDVNAALEMINKSKEVTQDAAQLLATLGQLQGQFATLAAKQQALSSSVAQLSGGMNQLYGPLNTLFAGTNSIRGAVGQLSAGANQLAGGVARTNTATHTLQSAGATLSSHSSELVNGANQVTDGSQQLTNKLNDAATTIAMQPSGDKTADQMSDPVTMHKNKRGNVPNYGYALAPYVLALGLYVGALVFSVIYPVRAMRGREKSGFGWALSKTSVLFVMGIGQVAVLALGMVGILGLHPEHPVGFMALLLVTSWTFLALTTFLAVTFNNPGRFMAMLLLVLQLGGSEGVFPLETAPAFFRAINPFLPMTYAIRGLREAISSDVGGQTIGHNLLIVLAFGVVATILLFIVLAIRHGRKFDNIMVTAK